MTGTVSADFDKVGRYTQDAINGFTTHMLRTFLELGTPQPWMSILDAMGGDGNFTLKVLAYAREHHWPCLPTVTMVELSRVQCGLAEAQLGTRASVVWGSILDPLPPGAYQRVYLKSGLHELPWEEQQQALRNIAQSLTEDGQFCQLGFALTDRATQAELQTLAAHKDTLAGLQGMAQRRHFPTRAEVEQLHEQAGLRLVRTIPCRYSIQTSVVAQQYFQTGHQRATFIEECEALFTRSHALRQAGRICVHGDDSTMTLPGLMTLAGRSENEG